MLTNATGQPSKVMNGNMPTKNVERYQLHNGNPEEHSSQEHSLVCVSANVNEMRVHSEADQIQESYVRTLQTCFATPE